MSSLPTPNLPSIHDPTPAPALLEEPGYSDNRVFRWVDDMPAPLHGRALQKEQIQSLYNVALTQPYRGVWKPLTQQFEMDDTIFEGMTNAEVMVYKKVCKAAAEGDDKAFDAVMDRVLGKPKQATEVVSMHVSYSDFLEQTAHEDRQTNPPIDVDFYTQAAEEEESLEELTRGI